MQDDTLNALKDLASRESLDLASELDKAERGGRGRAGLSARAASDALMASLPRHVLKQTKLSADDVEFLLKRYENGGAVEMARLRDDMRVTVGNRKPTNAAPVKNNDILTKSEEKERDAVLAKIAEKVTGERAKELAADLGKHERGSASGTIPATRFKTAIASAMTDRRSASALSEAQQDLLTRAYAAPGSQGQV